jgi:hypothetical protein
VPTLPGQVRGLCEASELALRVAIEGHVWAPGGRPERLGTTPAECVIARPRLGDLVGMQTQEAPGQARDLEQALPDPARHGAPADLPVAGHIIESHHVVRHGEAPSGEVQSTRDGMYHGGWRGIKGLACAWKVALCGLCVTTKAPTVSECRAT